MQRTVHLHGELGEKYGKSFTLAVETPGEAIRALITQISGLEQSIRAGEFICVRGTVDEGIYCEEPHLYLTFGGVKDFHIMPAAGGHGRGGGKILLGIALIAATVFTAGAALGAAGFTLAAGVSTFGVSGAAAAAFGGGIVGAIGGGLSLGMFALVGGGLLVAAGAAQALAAMPDAGDYADRNETDQRPGYLFNGAVNTSEQGGACPLVFGRILAGSVVVSAGITSERIATNAGLRANPGDAGIISDINTALVVGDGGSPELPDVLVNEV